MKYRKNTTTPKRTRFAFGANRTYGVEILVVRLCSFFRAYAIRPTCVNL